MNATIELDDRTGLGKAAAIIELKDGNLSGRILREEGGAPVLHPMQVNLLSIQDDLFLI